MRYTNAKLKEVQKHEVYRIYITDAIYHQGQNKTIGVRYWDLINPPKVDHRTGDEIAMEIIKKHGLRIE